MRLAQYGRESVVQPGECILVDCKEPYRLECLDATRCVAVRFPQDWLRNWLPAAESLANKPLPKTGLGRHTVGCARTVESTWEEELALPGSTVAEQIAVLLALAAGPAVRGARPTGTQRFMAPSSYRPHEHDDTERSRCNCALPRCPRGRRTRRSHSCRRASREASQSSSPSA